MLRRSLFLQLILLSVLTVAAIAQTNPGAGVPAAAYREALQEFTRTRVPLQWAATQMNLGNALLTLGERESGTARLDEDVSAYRAASQENTRERVPLDWAMTQNNLGAVLRVLGERESGTARLEEAAAAYRDALQERTRERAPLQWARSTGNQGVTLMLLAERRGDAEMAKLAVQQIEAAFTTMRDGGDAPSAADFGAQLPAARALAQKLATTYLTTEATWANQSRDRPAALRLRRI